MQRNIILLWHNSFDQYFVAPICDATLTRRINAKMREASETVKMCIHWSPILGNCCSGKYFSGSNCQNTHSHSVSLDFTPTWKYFHFVILRFDYLKYFMSLTKNITDPWTLCDLLSRFVKLIREWRRTKGRHLKLSREEQWPKTATAY